MKFSCEKSVPSFRQRGVSLIEFLVSIALGLAIIVAVLAVYIASRQSYRYQETSGRLQEDAGFALDLIAKDLRVAGFGGCLGVSAVTSTTGSPPVTSTTYFPTSGLSSANPDTINGPNPLATVEPTNAGVTAQPLMPGSIVRGFDSLPAAYFSGTAPTSNNANSLFFYSGGSNAVAVSAAMAAASSVLTIASDPYKWRDETHASGVFDMVVASCAASSLFKGKVNTAGTSISHDAALGNASASLAGGAMYGVDAMVYPVEWKFYYVDTRAGAATPSLYVVSYNGNQRADPQELVPNVESMQLHYGENTSVLTATPPATPVPPTLVTDVWRTSAADVSDWSRVTAVRIGLMMVSSEDNANPEVTLSTPKLLGQTYTVPTGASTKRVRKQFSTTVVLRNQIAAR